MDDDTAKKLSAALGAHARQFSARQDAWERHRQAVSNRDNSSVRGSRVPAPGRQARILPWAAAVAVIAAAAAGVFFSIHIPESTNSTHPQPPNQSVTTEMRSIATAPLAPCPVTSGAGSPSPSDGVSGAAGPALTTAAISFSRSSAALPTTITTAAAVTSDRTYTMTLDSSNSALVRLDNNNADAQNGTTPDVPADLAWFSTAKSRQLGSVFAASLPAGVAVYSNDQPANLPFGKTGWSEPGSSVLHDTVTASADLRSQHGAGSLVLTVSRAYLATPTCLDTGNTQTGQRTTYQDGTVVDQAEGVTPTDTYLTVFVYRPDGTNVRADLFEPLNAKVLTLRQLANAASAPGFDITTPPSAAEESAEPSVSASVTYVSGGGQRPAVSSQLATR